MATDDADVRDARNRCGCRPRTSDDQRVGCGVDDVNVVRPPRRRERRRGVMAISPLLADRDGRRHGLICRVDDLDCSAARHHVQRTSVRRHRKIRRVVADGDRGDDSVGASIDHRDGVGLCVRHIRAGAIAADGDACRVRCRPEPCAGVRRSPCQSPRRHWHHRVSHVGLRLRLRPRATLRRSVADSVSTQRRMADGRVHVVRSRNTSSCMRRMRRQARNRRYTERPRPAGGHRQPPLLTSCCRRRSSRPNERRQANRSWRRSSSSP